MKNPKIAVRLLLCAVIIEGLVTGGALVVAYRKPQVVYKHEGIKECQIIGELMPDDTAPVVKKPHRMKRKSHKPLCFNCPIHLSACQEGWTND